MNTCLFRDGSVLVGISLVRYKYVTIIMYIVKIRIRFVSVYKHNTQKKSKSTELKVWFVVLVFVFFLGNRVFFLLVGAGRLPRRCPATLRFFAQRRTHTQLSLLSSWRLRCGERAWSERYISGHIGVQNFTRKSIPINHFSWASE